MEYMSNGVFAFFMILSWGACIAIFAGPEIVEWIQRRLHKKGKK